MNDTLLKIAGNDVTKYICTGGLKVDESAVYDSNVSFTAMSGKERRKMIGLSVSISAVLTDVPTAAARSLISACNTDEIDVTYASPLMRSGKFGHPDISTDISYEEDSDRYYTVSLSLTCSCIPLEGL